MTVAKKVEFFLREKRCQKIKRNPVTDEFRTASVDEFDSDKREIFVSRLWRTYLAGYSISSLESVLLYLVL